MDIKEKLAYLKGLLEGSDLKLGEKEKKIVDAMMELLDGVVTQVSEFNEDLDYLYDGYETVCDSIDEIEEDLDYLFDESDFGDDDDEDEDDDDDEDDDEVLYDVECPNCKEIICVDEHTLLHSEIFCPACNEKLELDLCCCGECDEAAEDDSPED